MNSDDKTLGMDRAITRRDFINGVSIVVAASLLPGCGSEANLDAIDSAWQHERRQ